ncbi:aminoacyl-tRNA hydrolase [Bacillus mycoides]|uniref:Peptidyl-tRNA hydrolase n=2 Tax=Bacillus TaxID=1386 RepID=J8Y869_BACCE|nr:MULTISPECIES: aminoacyl-tRNA hydrolase [Bacillus cereus group]EJV78223.1 peptidyl-tRNA hydrolase [Bacillus cereus HuA2-1]EOO12731.1 peptidyl-tRNA hydrolase [Bacillus cereus HuA2-9]MCZ6942877.1 aminoacyl-tRNA hydrolase [Bacillus mycoides]
MRRNQAWLRLFVSKKESSGTRMKLIVGLGNPGREYELTRHNIGFMAIDELAKRWSISLNEQKFKGVFGAGFVNGEKVILLKPLTYMNLSGESIRPLMDYYKIDVEDFIVMYDDLDIPVGKLRLRMKGSAGGHNGVKSTISHLGTQEFQRIRMGIDRPKNGIKVVDYVLGRFTAEEISGVNQSIENAADACEEWLNKPFLQIMNTFNS